MAEASINQQALAGPDGQGMVAVAPRQLNPIDAVAQSRAVRHFGKLIGLAGAVAIGMVVVLWTAEPNYAPLYSNLSGKDAAQVADTLMSKNIDFRLDANSGALLVDQTRLAEARMLLASQGIADGGATGLEGLQQDQAIGTSQSMEEARYKHMLETELVRSVESLQAVESARVHLAIPEQSIFIRNRVAPSASVVVKLYPGRSLNDGNVEAIVQLIASSVPRLESPEVKVVDQFGRLLTDAADSGMAQTTRQFEYTQNLEDNHVDGIINLLQPIVGAGNVNAQVSAQIDFTAVESTREAFDPERSVIVSEQMNEEENRSLSQALGIPGALSNQPPEAGAVAPEAGAEAPGEAAVNNDIPANQNRSATRNYEVDRTITHKRNKVGEVQRLSVAVIIDDKRVVADDGSVSKTPYSDEEIARFTSLVKETVGFDANRGDSVSVINASFLEVDEPEVEPIPAWQALLNEAWVVNLIKQVLGAIGVILVYFIFIRPLMRSLSLKNADEGGAESDDGAVQTLGAPVPMQQAMAMGAQPQGGDPTAIPNLADDPNSPAALMRRKDATYEQKVDMARSLVMDDPARVANVMKNWVGDE